ncbi:MAG: hypothetical protein KF795_05075 [Labilithrix sp.]|nr:hypothetical protein [Labilithrix sp.]
MRVLTAHRGKASALWCGLAVLALSASCSRDPDIVERAVVVYSPRQCPVAQSEAYSVIYAAGDFEPSIDRPPTAGAFLNEVGRAMTGLPKETRSLVVDVSQRDFDWRGVADIPSSGPINVLVWRGGESCRLTRDVERRSEVALGVVGRHFIVAGGRSLSGSQVPHTYVGDLSTGAIERLEFGLNTRRSNPTITAFRAPSDVEGPSPALVAGGHDPESGIGDVPHRAIATAEVYVPRIGAPSDVGDFERGRIELSEPRTRHAAVVLATGETLLVGGRGPAGPLRSMEIVDPTTRRARTAGVALLNVARENPTVLRLANGEILVAGGLDAGKNEVPTLEWFAPDASRATKRPVDLVTGRERAFVALEAGGAIAVIRPESGLSDFKTVWVISADGTLEPGLPIDPAALEAVRLFPGAEGAPALWTGRRWMRWSPWFGGFEPMAVAPDPVKDPAAGPRLDVIASGDSGLALWLDDRDDAGFNVTGFRFATRTRFGAVPKPLLVGGTDQLAPDRLAGIPGSSIRFEPARGLVLGAGASAFLTDVTFADFELQVDVTAAAPSIVLRSDRGAELEVGGASCAFAQAAKQTLDVRRRGPRVTVSVDGAPERSCPTELETGARVTLGLRGAQGVSVSAARNLRVTRR